MKHEQLIILSLIVFIVVWCCLPNMIVEAKADTEEIHTSGELTENTIWSGNIIVDETVLVPADIVLTIEPGTVISMKDSVSIIVYGQLLSEGTEAQPIRFTRYDNNLWKQIKFIEAQDSRFVNCIIEYADSEGAHQDYYEAGPRDYHEAVVALASQVDIENCTFEKLPDESGDAEGDAIAIISDDPEYPGDASAHIKNCQFLSSPADFRLRTIYAD